MERTASELFPDCERLGASFRIDSHYGDEEDTAMEIAPGYVIRCLNWQTIRLNNWLDAEIVCREGDTFVCMPQQQVDRSGKPLTPFTVDRATLEDLVRQGAYEVVPVVEAQK